MLIKDVVQGYNGRVKFVSENWGESKLAERFGVKRYPVVFVEDVLVAKPDDFGGWGKPTGKYAPWREASSHEKFKRDLRQVIDLALRNRIDLAGKYRSEPDHSEIASLPAFTLQTLSGESLESASLAGQVVVVEFWATWCPPCRSTLGWLGEVERRYGDKVTVIAMALDSEEPEVRKLIESLKLPVQVTMGKEEVVSTFGTVTSIPTMFVFDREGKTASVFYGAPQDLHQRVTRLIDSLVR